MKLLYAGYFDYKPGSGYGKTGRCWLRLYTGPGRAVAVVSELNDNPGMSVSNAAEGVRAAVEKLLAEYGLVPDGIALRVFDHFNDVMSYGFAPGSAKAERDRYCEHRLVKGSIEMAPAVRDDIGRALAPVRSGEEWPALVDIPIHVIAGQRASV